MKKAKVGQVVRALPSFTSPKLEEFRWKYISCSLQKFPSYNHHSKASYMAALQMNKCHAGKEAGEQFHAAWDYEPSTMMAAAESGTVLSVDGPSFSLAFVGWQIVVCNGESWLLTASPSARMDGTASTLSLVNGLQDQVLRISDQASNINDTSDLNPSVSALRQHKEGKIDYCLSSTFMDNIKSTWRN